MRSIVVFVIIPFSVLALAAAAALGVVFGDSPAPPARALEDAVLKDGARMAALGLAQALEERRGRLASWAANPLVLEAVTAQANRTPGPEVPGAWPDALARWLDRLARDHEDIWALAVFDAEGIVRAAGVENAPDAEALRGTSMADRQYFRGVMAGQAQRTPVYRPATGDFEVLAQAVPVADAAGLPRGGLVAVMRWESLWRGLAAAERPAGARLVVLDGQGRRLAADTVDGPVPPVLESLEDSPLYRALRDMDPEGPQAVTFEAGGRAMRLAAAPVPGADWLAAMAAPESGLPSAGFSRRTARLAVWPVAITLLAGLALAGAYYVAVRPVGVLARRLREAAQDPGAETGDGGGFSPPEGPLLLEVGAASRAATAYARAVGARLALAEGILNAMPAAVLATDTDDRLVYATRKGLELAVRQGRTPEPEASLGLPVGEVAPGLGAGGTEAGLLSSTVRRGEGRRREAVLPGGRRLAMESAPVWGAGGKALGAVVVLADNAETARLEARVKELETALAENAARAETLAAALREGLRRVERDRAEAERRLAAESARQDRLFAPAGRLAESVGGLAEDYGKARERLDAAQERLRGKDGIAGSFAQREALKIVGEASRALARLAYKVERLGEQAEALKGEDAAPRPSGLAALSTAGLQNDDDGLEEALRELNALAAGLRKGLSRR